MASRNQHNAGRTGRQKESQPYQAQIGRIDVAVAVEIGIRIRAAEIQAEISQIQKIHDAVLVEVAVAEVTKAVAVGITLSRVDGLNAVVQAIQNAISVTVIARSEQTKCGHNARVIGRPQA